MHLAKSGLNLHDHLLGSLSRFLRNIANIKMFEDVTKASELVPIKIIVETPDLDAGLRLLEKFRKWQ